MMKSNGHFTWRPTCVLAHWKWLDTKFSCHSHRSRVKHRRKGQNCYTYVALPFLTSCGMYSERRFTCNDCSEYVSVAVTIYTSIINALIAIIHCITGYTHLRVSWFSLVSSNYFLIVAYLRNRGSSVSIVSDYGLDDRAIDFRSPAEAKVFFF
jgi:hypothetical protein